MAGYLHGGQHDEVGDAYALRKVVGGRKAPFKEVGVDWERAALRQALDQVLHRLEIDRRRWRLYR